MLQRFHVTEDGEIKVLPHNPEKRLGCKFLYFKSSDSELLVVGRKDMKHKDLLLAYESLKGSVDKTTMKGAGEIGFSDGSVGSWHSAGFGLNTAPELRNHISKLLARP